ncbi:MAG: hypothetical protein IPP46_13245 [Bacteroidetes bacterium]|nr:hypothetical protein [Bacteroidota bacterium]
MEPLPGEKLSVVQGDDRAFAARQTSDGGYIVTGTSNSPSGDVTNNRGGFDIFLLKINASGIKIWWKNIGGSDDDEARSVWQHSDGGYILAGGTKSDDQQLNNNKGGYDFLVARVNSAGSLRWCRNYGGSSDEIASGLQQTSAGDIIVAGSTTSNDNNVSNNKGGSDYWVVRLKGMAISNGQKPLEVRIMMKLLLFNKPALETLLQELPSVTMVTFREQRRG